MTPLDDTGQALRRARKQLGLRQRDVAERCGVAVALVRDVELGRRPDLPLRVALDLLGAVGVRVRVIAPSGEVVDLESPSAATHARAARAAHRRATWTGARRSLTSADDPPSPGTTPFERLAAVTIVSSSTHALAAAGDAHDGRRPGRPARQRRSSE